MIGSTLGINLNIPLATSNSLFEMMDARIIYSPIELDVQVIIKKGFYIAPHAGFWTSYRLGNRLGLYFQTLFHFPVPEYVWFITSYRGAEEKYIVEENTNKNFGVTIIVGVRIWIGRILQYEQ